MRRSRWPHSRQVAQHRAPRRACPRAIREKIDVLSIRQIWRCWTHDGSPESPFVPAIRVKYDEGGASVGEPVLLDLPLGPDQVRVAAAALKAIRRCNSLRIPPDLAPYPEPRRQRVIRFDTGQESAAARPTADPGPAAIRAVVRDFHGVLSGSGPRPDRAGGRPTARAP